MTYDDDDDDFYFPSMPDISWKKEKLKWGINFLLMLNQNDPDIATSPNIKSHVVLLIDVCKIFFVNI